MLVLTRQVGDEIVIDGKIRIRITAIRGRRVRVGVTAPPDVAVQRHEVHEQSLECDQPLPRTLLPA